MIHLVDKNIEAYAQEHSSDVPALLGELRKYTYANVDLPQMQVGPLEGNFLKVLVSLTAAKKIVEVGTFTGYSGLMMASALPEDGRLITCELEPKHAEIAQSFFDRSPYGHRIKIELGPAAETLERLDGPFDMAFIDADKGNYIRYFDLILPKMRKRGLIAVDNVLWSGRVLEDPDAMTDETRSIAAFNQHLNQLTNLDKVMVTIRDGITLVVT